VTTENMNLQHLTELKQELSVAYKKMSLDAWSLYLYGIVLKKLRILDEAYNILLEAISLEPIHWGAWLELAGLIKSRTEVKYHLCSGYIKLNLVYGYCGSIQDTRLFRSAVVDVKSKDHYLAVCKVNLKLKLR
jgi:tetratricopeptide (TPR) repeat protein